MKARIGFSSVLGTDYMEDLEMLLFFNPQQGRTLSAINDSIKDYGIPHIYVEEGHLRVGLKDLPGTQTLFALEDTLDRPELVGVMVFHRVDVETIVLLHIAVRQEYSRYGSRADAGLVSRMIAELRGVARKLKGVRSIQLTYLKGVAFPV